MPDSFQHRVGHVASAPLHDLRIPQGSTIDLNNIIEQDHRFVKKASWNVRVSVISSADATDATFHGKPRKTIVVTGINKQ